MLVAVVGLQAARTIVHAARGAALVARVPMNEEMPPVAQRTFRHHETGELAYLVVRQIPDPGRQIWWSVELLRADGSCPLAGTMAITWRKTREEARQLWAERELRAAGYVREQADHVAADR